MAIIENYVPAFPPRELSPQAQQFLSEELARIAAIINAGAIYLEPLGVEPDKPSNGLIVYADGTGWNPGSGAGFYGYEEGTWQKL